MKTNSQHALKAFNTFGVEAYATHITQLKSTDDAINQWQQQGPPDLILGSGSNVLLMRQHFDRVWLNRITGRQVLERNAKHVRMRFGAGENWDEAVAWSLDQGAYGLENLSLIPGRCGAAPIQNIGAYGVELASFVHAVEWLELNSGIRQRYNRAQCNFSYRNSYFREQPLCRILILALELDLYPEANLSLEYPGVQQEITALGLQKTTAQNVRKAIIGMRRRKLPDPEILGNAGSFFKNPIISPSRAAELTRQFPAMPSWPDKSSARIKLSAAWLIDQCGYKGYRTGDAGVHQHHALVLVNHGRASGQDILNLATEIQQTVQSRFGIQLAPEPLIIR